MTGLGVSFVTMLVLTTVLMLWAAAAAAVDAAIRGRTWPTYSRVQPFPLLPVVMIRHRSQWTSPGLAHRGAWMRSCCSRRAWCCGWCLCSPAPGACSSSRPSACFTKKTCVSFAISTGRGRVVTDVKKYLPDSMRTPRHLHIPSCCSCT